METGPSFNPEEVRSHETTPKEQLYQDQFIEVYHPTRQAFPKAEGIQLVVEPLKDDLLGEVRAQFIGLAVGKVIAEGKYTEDFWANIHRNAHPGTEKGINVFGRNPQSEGAWGKPVDIREKESREPEPLDEHQKEKLARTLSLYIPKWEQAGTRITLFEDGIKPTDSQNEAFLKQRTEDESRNWPWQSVTVWMDDKYTMSLQLQPHIKGIHLVIGGRYSHWSKLDRSGFREPEKIPIRSWETPQDPQGSLEYLKGVLESFVILRVAQEILEKEIDQKFSNGEIHFSGNWGFRPRDAKPEDGGRRVDESYLAKDSLEDQERKRKQTKVRHRGEWMLESGNWASHGHYYATTSPEEYVSLPTRSKLEKPEEWQDIPEIDVREAEKLADDLGRKLTERLKNLSIEKLKLF